MANKALGYGTVVKVDHDGNSTFTAVGSIKEVTPPERSRKTVDGTTLDDAREVMDPGQEEATDFEFTQFWKQGDTTQGYIDTLFTNKTDVDWQVIYPQDTPITEAFSGWVKKIGPTVGGGSEYWQRKITVQTTSASTLS